MSKLLSSRRFWVFVLAQVISIATLVLAHYLTDPFNLELAKMFIGLVEGTGGIVIVAYTVDDTASHVQAIKSGVHPDYPEPKP
jgi:hypothetical protein